MRVITIDGDKKVTDLEAGYKQASQFKNYDGNENSKMYWLMVYYQLKALKGGNVDKENVLKKIESKLKKSSEKFDNYWNDSKARNLNFCGAGNMSKASSNYRNNHREQIGRAAIETTKDKLVKKIVEFTINTPQMNGQEMLLLMNELDINKNLSDSFQYYDRQENGLLQIHSNLLLWLNKYAPSYVTNYIGTVIGKRWARID
jgi:hypothetical protein